MFKVGDATLRMNTAFVRVCVVSGHLICRTYRAGQPLVVDGKPTTSSTSFRTRSPPLLQLPVIPATGNEMSWNSYSFREFFTKDPQECQTIEMYDLSLDPPSKAVL